MSSAISRVARAHKALAVRLLRATGLRPGQEVALMTLWQHCAQRYVRLVQTLDSDAPTMARGIDRPAQAGPVRSRLSPAVRRATIIETTEAGPALRPPVEATWSELELHTVCALSPQRERAAVTALAQLEANLADAGEQPPELG